MCQGIGVAWGVPPKANASSDSVGIRRGWGVADAREADYPKVGIAAAPTGV